MVAPDNSSRCSSGHHAYVELKVQQLSLEMGKDCYCWLRFRSWLPNVNVRFDFMRFRRFDGFDCSSLTAEIFNQRYYIFYYIEDMKRILLPVIVCGDAPYGLRCYSAAGSVTLAANGSFVSYRSYTYIL